MKKLAFVGLLLGAAVASQATLYTFTQPGAAIPASGPITPITFSVGALDGPVIDVDFVFNGLSHTFPDDIGSLLLGPGGQYVVFFDGPGGGDDLVNVTWTFDDAAAAPLSNSGLNPTGTYKPGVQYQNDTFTGFGPSGNPAPVLLSVFNGVNPTGTWTLFLEDFVAGDGGSLASVDLKITTAPVPEPASIAALGVGLLALKRRRKSA